VFLRKGKFITVLFLLVQYKNGTDFIEDFVTLKKALKLYRTDFLFGIYLLSKKRAYLLLCFAQKFGLHYFY